MIFLYPREYINSTYEIDFDKLYKDMQSLCITTDKMINKFERISNVDLKGEHV